VASELKANWDALQKAVHGGVAGVCKALADQLIGQLLAPALTALSGDERCWYSASKSAGRRKSSPRFAILRRGSAWQRRCFSINSGTPCCEWAAWFAT